MKDKQKNEKNLLSTIVKIVTLCTGLSTLILSYEALKNTIGKPITLATKWLFLDNIFELYYFFCEAFSRKKLFFLIVFFILIITNLIIMGMNCYFLNKDNSELFNKKHLFFYFISVWFTIINFISIIIKNGFIENKIINSSFFICILGILLFAVVEFFVFDSSPLLPLSLGIIVVNICSFIVYFGFSYSSSVNIKYLLLLLILTAFYSALAFILYDLREYQAKDTLLTICKIIGASFSVLVVFFYLFCCGGFEYIKGCIVEYFTNLFS